MLIQSLHLDIQILAKICYMVSTYLTKVVRYTIVKALSLRICLKKDKSYLVIDNFNRIDPDIFQTYINVLEGYEVTLPRYNKEGNMIKWSKEKDSFYHFNPNWHIIGVTYDSLEEIQQKYSQQFLKYTRIVKVNQD